MRHVYTTVKKNVVFACIATNGESPYGWTDNPYPLIEKLGLSDGYEIAQVRECIAKPKPKAKPKAKAKVKKEGDS